MRLVSGWLQREVSRGYEVGQFWYLISSEWWSHWTSYTGGQCHCRSSGSRIIYPLSVDEAVICDESFTSNSTGILEYKHLVNILFFKFMIKI